MNFGNLDACGCEFLIQLISEWVPLGFLKFRFFLCGRRGIVLEPPCPRSVDGISIDPEPNWNFNSLLSEIDSVEKKLNNVFSKFPQPLTHTTLRYISLFIVFCIGYEFG